MFAYICACTQEDSERLGIEEAIKHFFVFKEAVSNQEHCDVLVDAFQVKEFPEGTTLIEQGADGLDFFVLLEGSVEISVTGVGVVKTCSAHTPDCYFGELALLYNKPRAASVVSTTAIKVPMTPRLCASQPTSMTRLSSYLCRSEYWKAAPSSTFRSRNSNYKMRKPSLL